MIVGCVRVFQIPICILNGILSGKVKQEARIQKHKYYDCFIAVCCNFCAVHQMYVEVGDELPSCSNVWIA